MLFTDLISHSYRTVISHKLRSSLTALGLVIGIAAVIILTSIGRGIHTYVLAEFTQFGTNLVAVFPGKTTTLAHLRHFYLSKLLIYRSHKIFIKKAPLKSKVFFLRLL